MKEKFLGVSMWENNQFVMQEMWTFLVFFPALKMSGIN